MIRRRYSRKTGFRVDYTDTFQRSCRRRGHDTDLKGTISRTFLCPIATFLRLKLCLVEYADKRICKNEKCRETGLACLYRAKEKQILVDIFSTLSLLAVHYVLSMTYTLILQVWRVQL